MFIDDRLVADGRQGAVRPPRAARRKSVASRADSGRRNLGISRPPAHPYPFGGDLLGGVRPSRADRACGWTFASARNCGATAPTALREAILARAWREEKGAFVGALDDDDLDASVLLLAELGLVKPNDPRFLTNLRGVEPRLERDGLIMRYVGKDDFGLPETAFLVCSFWHIDALASIGQRDKAREMFSRTARKAQHLRIALRGLAPEDRRSCGEIFRKPIRWPRSSIRRRGSLSNGRMHGASSDSGLEPGQCARWRAAPGGRPHRRGQCRVEATRRRVVRLERKGQRRRRVAAAYRRRSAGAAPISRSISRRPTSRNITTASPIACFGRCCIIASIWPSSPRSISAAISASTRISPTRLSQFITPDDVIWVHDYHLLPFAKELRRAGTTIRSASSCIFPARRPTFSKRFRIMRRPMGALSHYDLVGLQTEQDADNLSRYFAGSPATVNGRRRLFEFDGRRVRVRAFPVAIATAVYARAARNSVKSPLVEDLRNSLRRQASDPRRRSSRLFEGHPQRIQAFGQFPREISAMARQGDLSASHAEEPGRRSRICRDGGGGRAHSSARSTGAMATRPGRRSATSTAPIRARRSRGFIVRRDVGLVTPLRDGMNLVAKEYVAAQDPDNPGRPRAFAIRGRRAGTRRRH